MFQEGGEKKKLNEPRRQKLIGHNSWQQAKHAKLYYLFQANKRTPLITSFMTGRARRLNFFAYDAPGRHHREKD